MILNRVSHPVYLRLTHKKYSDTERIFLLIMPATWRSSPSARGRCFHSPRTTRGGTQLATSRFRPSPELSLGSISPGHSHQMPGAPGLPAAQGRGPACHNHAAFPSAADPAHFVCSGEGKGLHLKRSLQARPLGA